MDAVEERRPRQQQQRAIRGSDAVTDAHGSVDTERGRASPTAPHQRQSETEDAKEKIHPEILGGETTQGKPQK